MNFNELNNYGIDENFVKRCIKDYQRGEVTIAVTGEFSSGKSCFINALMKQKDLLPVGDSECTSIYVDLSYGDERRLSVMSNDGNTEPLDYTKEQIDKYARYTPNSSTDALALIAEFPEFTLNKNIHIFDCPGTNTIIPEHEKITEMIVQRSDMIVYVINKVISGESLKKIESFYDMNEDMIFVLTHMDSDDGTEMQDSEIINKYMDEARSVLADGLGILPTRVQLYSAGSKYAFNNESSLDEIRAELSRKADTLRIQVLRNKAKQKLIHYLDNVLLDEKNRIEIIEKIKQSEHSSKKIKVEDVRRNIETVKNSLRLSEESDSVFVNARIEELMKRINRLSSESADRVINSIRLSSNNTPDEIQSEIEKEVASYNKSIKTEIKKTILLINKDEYEAVSNEVKKLNDVFNGCSSEMFEITAPDLYDVEPSETGSTNYLRKKIENSADEIAELESQRDEELEKISDIETDLVDDAEDIKDKKAELDELGKYKAEYYEEIEEGGSRVGATVGKVAGLLGDIALLVFTPEAAPLKAVDVAKDIATITNIGVSSAERIVEVISDNKKGSSDKSEKHDKKTKKQKEKSGKNKKGEKNNNSGEKKSKGQGLKKVSKILNMISLSSWGEKAGSAIGEYIKPTTSFKKENLEKREEYYSQRESLDSDIARMEVLLNSKKDEIEYIRNNSPVLDKLKEARIKLEMLEESLRNEEKENQIKLKEEQSRLTKEYYCKCIEAGFVAMAQENIEVVKEIMEQARELLHEASVSMAEQKINELEEIFDSVQNDENEVGRELDDCRRRLSEINSIKDNIDDWLDENAG